jgi:mRNA interferase RelE/StbE
MNNAGKAAKKSIRIVYRIIDQEILVEVVAIGKREDLAVYQEALKRLTQRKR